MIKLISIEPKGAYKLLLRFSDGAWGIYDFSRYVQAGTQMTEPLKDPDYFKRYFIELGALAWPNGFDLSAESLNSRLQEAGELHRDTKVA
ncbi:MAG: DUF2442 domain-containing protein [Candidatus Acidiferrales bacterium]